MEICLFVASQPKLDPASRNQCSGKHLRNCNPKIHRSISLPRKLSADSGHGSYKQTAIKRQVNQIVNSRLKSSDTSSDISNVNDNVFDQQRVRDRPRVSKSMEVFNQTGTESDAALKNLKREIWLNRGSLDVRNSNDLTKIKDEIKEYKTKLRQNIYYLQMVRSNEAEKASPSKLLPTEGTVDSELNSLAENEVLPLNNYQEVPRGLKNKHFHISRRPTNEYFKKLLVAVPGTKYTPVVRTPSEEYLRTISERTEIDLTNDLFVCNVNTESINAANNIKSVPAKECRGKAAETKTIRELPKRVKDCKVSTKMKLKEIPVMKTKQTSPNPTSVCCKNNKSIKYTPVKRQQVTKKSKSKTQLTAGNKEESNKKKGLHGPCVKPTSLSPISESVPSVVKNVKRPCLNKLSCTKTSKRNPNVKASWKSAPPSDNIVLPKTNNESNEVLPKAKQTAGIQKSASKCSLKKGQDCNILCNNGACCSEGDPEMKGQMEIVSPQFATLRPPHDIVEIAKNAMQNIDFLSITDSCNHLQFTYVDPNSIIQPTKVEVYIAKLDITTNAVVNTDCNSRSYSLDIKESDCPKSISPCNNAKPDKIFDSDKHMVDKFVIHTMSCVCIDSTLPVPNVQRAQSNNCKKTELMTDQYDNLDEIDTSISHSYHPSLTHSEACVIKVMRYLKTRVNHCHHKKEQSKICAPRQDTDKSQQILTVQSALHAIEPVLVTDIPSNIACPSCADINMANLERGDTGGQCCEGNNKKRKTKCGFDIQYNSQDFQSTNVHISESDKTNSSGSSENSCPDKNDKLVTVNCYNKRFSQVTSTFKKAPVSLKKFCCFKVNSEEICSTDESSIDLQPVNLPNCAMNDSKYTSVSQRFSGNAVLDDHSSPFPKRQCFTFRDISTQVDILDTEDLDKSCLCILEPESPQKCTSTSVNDLLKPGTSQCEVEDVAVDVDTHETPKDTTTKIKFQHTLNKKGSRRPGDRNSEPERRKNIKSQKLNENIKNYTLKCCSSDEVVGKRVCEGSTSSGKICDIKAATRKQIKNLKMRRDIGKPVAGPH